MNHNDERVPLVPWSGGIDSTALVIYYFSHKIPFETCYVKISHNAKQQGAELKAREKIKKKLSELYSGNFLIKDTIIDFPYTGVNNNYYHLIQSKMWLDSIMIEMDLSRFYEIAFAYILEDHFWHIRDKVEKIYEITFQHLLSKVRYKNPEAPMPKLLFPFEWNDKKSLYESYYKDDETLREVFKLIWTCENPKNLTTPCNDCNKCKEIKLLTNGS